MNDKRISLKKSCSLIMFILINKSLDATFQCEHRDELSMPVSMRGLIKGRRDCIVCERMAPLNRVQSTPPKAPTISEILLMPKYYSTTLLLEVTASNSKSKSKSDQICNCMQRPETGVKHISSAEKDVFFPLYHSVTK